MNADLLNPTTILIEDELYNTWPNYGHQSVERLRGLWNPKYLQHLLNEKDLFCDTWRRPIPLDVLRELQRYCDHHSELIELAQLDPIRFVRLSRSNPAMAIAIATYWAFQAPWEMPPRDKRDAFRLKLLMMKPRLMLSELGHPERDEWVHLMQKLSGYNFGVYLIKRALHLFEDHKLRRHLRHLPAITVDILWLLQHPSLPVDMPLLELAIKEPAQDGFLLVDLVSNILTTREMSCREPAWPYRGTIRSWQSLLRAEWRNALRCGAQSLQFPRAPLPVDTLPEGLELHPLTCPRDVKEEADLMQNCSLEYSDDIQKGERYLYRIKKPERATLLLQLESSGWEIEQIGLYANAGKIRQLTENLIYRWIRQNKKMA
ncbi:MAG: hypothetical protein ACSHX4_10860 [Opitutaceae bacterium]